MRKLLKEAMEAGLRAQLEGRINENRIHASDSIASALRESGVLFGYEKDKDEAERLMVRQRIA